MKTICLITLINAFLIFITAVMGQDTVNQVNKSHVIAARSGFSQYKDGFNYGLVYSGLTIGANYSFIRLSQYSNLQYDAGLAAGFSFNQGTGYAVKIKPVDIFYGYRISSGGFTLGGYFADNYLWQLYPEIQSGHMFWFTMMDIGPQAIYRLPYKQGILEIRLSNSVAGLTSRPEPSTETYYYSLRISDYIKNSHQNLTAGSFNNFNHTFLKIELHGKRTRRMSVAYSFEYFAYFRDPEISLINHLIDLKWIIGRI